MVAVVKVVGSVLDSPVFVVNGERVMLLTDASARRSGSEDSGCLSLINGSYSKLGHRARVFGLIQVGALFLLLGLEASLAADDGAAIVDVRVDAPYGQIEISVGDEWAPTWARDDALYTGSNDGSSFGSIRPNAIAFGKLEGDDPYKLKGATINGMDEFREGKVAAEAAKWKAVHSLEINQHIYRFAPCGFDTNRSAYSCLLVSEDGVDWKNSGSKADLFRGTRFQSPTFISIRKEDELSMGSGDEFVFAAAYDRTSNGEDSFILGRVKKEKLTRMSAADWTFIQKDLSWGTGLDGAVELPNSTTLGLDGANWKTTNSYSVEGVLYMFVTRCFYPTGSSDPNGRHNFQNSSIIKSTDSGRTWTRPADINLRDPMFPGSRFGTAYFVWYGKDGVGVVDNADRYVYAVSNNGHFENGDDYVIGRVLRSKLPRLSAADWSFYTKGDGMRDESWSPRLDAALPILSNPSRSGMTGMTYVEGLRRYVMVSWHYNQQNFAAGVKEKDLSTALEFFEAPKPWGPWTKFKTLQTQRLGWFAPIIGQRFQTVKNSGTVGAFLYASGFRAYPEGGLDFSMYRLNYMPISLSTRPLQHKSEGFIGGR